MKVNELRSLKVLFCEKIIRIFRCMHADAQNPTSTLRWFLNAATLQLPSPLYIWGGGGREAWGRGNPSLGRTPMWSPPPRAGAPGEGFPPNPSRPRWLSPQAKWGSAQRGLNQLSSPWHPSEYSGRFWTLPGPSNAH